jgi:hypothetical protein
VRRLSAAANLQRTVCCVRTVLHICCCVTLLVAAAAAWRVLTAFISD